MKFSRNDCACDDRPKPHSYSPTENPVHFWRAGDAKKTLFRLLHFTSITRDYSAQPPSCANSSSLGRPSCRFRKKPGSLGHNRSTSDPPRLLWPARFQSSPDHLCRLTKGMCQGVAVEITWGVLPTTQIRQSQSMKNRLAVSGKSISRTVQRSECRLYKTSFLAVRTVNRSLRCTDVLVQWLFYSVNS